MGTQHRQTDRQTERQTDRERDRETDRQTERERSVCTSCRCSIPARHFSFMSLKCFFLIRQDITDPTPPPRRSSSISLLDSASSWHPHNYDICISLTDRQTDRHQWLNSSTMIQTIIIINVNIIIGLVLTWTTTMSIIYLTFLLQCAGVDTVIKTDKTATQWHRWVDYSHY